MVVKLNRFQCDPQHNYFLSVAFYTVMLSVIMLIGMGLTDSHKNYLTACINSLAIWQKDHSFFIKFLAGLTQGK